LDVAGNLQNLNIYLILNHLFRRAPRLDVVAKLHWRIERDYQELKQEVGLGHFEGRGWRGFHHHATLCIAAYGFLISERETIPPSGDRATTRFPQFALREGYQLRGFAVAA
jgi:Transposase DDE domain